MELSVVEPNLEKSKRIVVTIGFIVGVVMALVIILFSFVMLPLLIKASIVPTPKLAEQTCSELNGEFEVGDITTSPQEFIDKNIKTAHTCSVKESDDSNTGFQLMTFEEDNLDNSTVKKAIYSFIAADEEYISSVEDLLTTVEDGQKIYKSYLVLDDDGRVCYFAAYKNAFVMIVSNSLEDAENTLVKLGYPEQEKTKITSNY